MYEKEQNCTFKNKYTLKRTDYKKLHTTLKEKLINKVK